MKPLINAMAKPATITLKVYEDPAHGWIACKRSLLEQLGILNKITPYSYQSRTGDTVYCEEDCDGSLLVSTLMGRLGYEVQPAQEVDYNVAYASVAQGDGTFLAFNWIPLHNHKYEQAGGDKVFFRQGTYASGAAQGYLIDFGLRTCLESRHD